MASPLTYKKMKGFATTNGQQYEVNLAALLFLRGLNSGLEFELGTNVQGAGAMDDVVFRYKSSRELDIWTTLYVQLKYKANSPINRTMLTNPKGDFSLPKYFVSYLQIKKAMTATERETLFDGSFDNCMFLIFTNAKCNQYLREERCATLNQAEGFVWCGSGNVLRFEKDEDILKCLGGGDDDQKAFLGSLRVFCGQPTANRLHAEIEKELRKVDGEVVDGVDFKSLVGIFLHRMKIWWEKSSEVLHKGNDILRTSVLEITAQQTEKGYRLDIDFEEAALKKLRVAVSGDCKIVTVCSSERSCRLSLTKLCQAFGGQPIVLNCEGLLANKGALLAQCMKGVVKGVIICTNGWSSSHQVDYFKVAKDLLDIPNTPTIVFVANDEHDEIAEIAGEFQGLVENCKDEFTFAQMKQASREKILAKEVSLQGHSTTLGRLLFRTPGCADRVLDACCVVENLECVGSLVLGSALGEGIGFYVHRHLELTTVVKASVFQDGTLQESITVRVMGCESSPVSPLFSGVSNSSGLFEKAIRFLFSSNDFSSFHNINLEKIVSKLYMSQLIADKHDCEVLIGSHCRLGLFECSSVGLRLGEQDSVTALWVRTSEHPTQAGFLFVSDKSSESDVRKLSDFHQSKHLLSLKDGTLRWIQSHGNIESIRPHIDEAQVSTFAPENAMDVEDRLVLVCAEPGMGKSTLMARLAKNTKEAYPHFFVFLIALNAHSELFAQNKHKNALEYLCRANNIDSHLHRSLLRYALEISGDVVVLFDGFDEIAPMYVEQSCDLLSCLMQETKACKIWMTSRNSVKLTLEARIATFSGALRQFEEGDQKRFFRMFWQEKLTLSTLELETFINQLIHKTSRAVRDKDKNFMGIPLQTRMLAEVYEDLVSGTFEKINLPDRLELLVLLEQFVDKKCSIYVQDKFKIERSKVTNYGELYGILKKEFVRRHMDAALGLILDNDTIKSLRLESIIRESSEFFQKITRGDDKTGFIDDIVNDRPRFVHRVFAEYFLAKWISSHFADNRELVETKMFTDDFVVVRNLFDRLLAKGYALHTAVLNEDLVDVKTLLERGEADVNEKDGGGRTALHLAAGLATTEDQEENKMRAEILDLLVDKTSDFNNVDDVLDGSPLKYADITRSWAAVDRLIPYTDCKQQLTQTLRNTTNHSMLSIVFSADLHNLLGFCLDNGLTDTYCSEGKSLLLFRACELGSVKVASLLMKRNPAINDLSGQSKSFLHKASDNGHLEIVKLLHQHHISTLGNALSHKLTGSQKQQAVDYINMVNILGRTAIHYAAWKGHSAVIRFLISQGGDPQVRSHHNSTPLHLAARCRHAATVRVLLEALDEPERVAAVNICDENGDTALICGALGGSLECVDLLVQAGGKLTQASGERRKPLMAAAREGHHEIVSYLLSHFNPEIEGMSRVDYINMADTHGVTAIHHAARNGHAEVIRFLMSLGGDSRSRDHDDETTPLHTAARFKHADALRVLLEALDEADRPAAVNACDKDGVSVLLSAAFGGCEECVEQLVEADAKMTHASDDGRTPLMAAALYGHDKVVSYLLNGFSAGKEGVCKLDYINMAAKDGWSAIHFAAWTGQSDVIRFLIRHGGDPQRRDRNNSTPLHFASENNHPGAVQVFLEALDEADRAAAVNSCNNVGDSVLMCAALGGCVECVCYLIRAGGMLSLGNCNQRTPLMTAAAKGHTPVVGYLLSAFSREREGLTRRAYIKMADKDGRTALDLAVPCCREMLHSFLKE